MTAPLRDTPTPPSPAPGPPRDRRLAVWALVSFAVVAGLLVALAVVAHGRFGPAVRGLPVPQVLLAARPALARVVLATSGVLLGTFTALHARGMLIS